jgi:hypothetical protein
MNKEDAFRELVESPRKFVETLFTIEGKDTKSVPFLFNDIQSKAYEEQTGRDIWVKPSQVGFSSGQIAAKLAKTITTPGTNTVLIAYEDFITERLLSKADFFYNSLLSYRIPNFPKLRHNSTYEKTYEFVVDGVVKSKSSIYISSARSYVAGRAETIHHLLLDELAFYSPGATERILEPAMARVPPDGTIDIFSTPNGKNEFYEIYMKAKEGRSIGKSIFTAHFFPWFDHNEYRIEIGDKRVEAYLPETNSEEFDITSDEQLLMNSHNLSFSQIRWRRWMQLSMDSLRKRGETRNLFKQEFPEDDVSCFLTSGDMLYDEQQVEQLAKSCYPAPTTFNAAQVWYQPEPGKQYMVCCDPGQAKITQTAISVIRFDQDSLGNIVPVHCARDAGLYPPEIGVQKAVALSDHYNRALITWEANGHGLAWSELLKHRRPIYYRRDIVSGKVSSEPGWLTTGGRNGTKAYMFQTVARYLHSIKTHDIEFVSQLQNLRVEGDKVVVVGADDIHDSVAIGLVCYQPPQRKRGLVGTSGYKW